MTPENFVYWLQGFLEISDTESISEKQVQIIQDHIDLVLTKVTPDRKFDIPVRETQKKDKSSISDFITRYMKQQDEKAILPPTVYC